MVERGEGLKTETTAFKGITLASLAEGSSFFAVKENF